jgi:TonB family protein
MRQRLFSLGNSCLAAGLLLYGQGAAPAQRPGAEPFKTLSDKYGHLQDVLRGSSGLLRLNTTYAPLPPYPESTRKKKRQGLVVVEVVVSPEGKVQEHLVHESFDEDAARSVVETLRTWRFHSIEEMKRNGAMEDCEKCIRIGRLEFRFVLEGDTARVVDLADEENRRIQRPNPFEKKRP